MKSWKFVSPLVAMLGVLSLTPTIIHAQPNQPLLAQATDRTRDLTRDQDRDRTQHREKEGDQKREQDRKQEQIYGSQMMTEAELNQYRQQMRNMKTNEEQEAFRIRHQERMNERARERGITLPDESPAGGKSR